MGLTGKAKKDYQREYMKRKRSNRDILSPESVKLVRERQGITETTSDTVTPDGIKYYIPDIIDKLTDKVWRNRFENICNSFRTSHHPDYISDVWLGNYNLADVCGMMECTR